jgi:hypothetical protein
VRARRRLHRRGLAALGLTRALLPVGLAVVALLARARAARGAPDADLVAALDDAAGADVVAFELPAPARAPHVRAATTTRAPLATVLAVLGDPSRYAAMIPSLIRSREVGRRGDARVVEWELEVPLFNLSGTMELRSRPGGLELAMVDGDLSPGRVVFETSARPDGGTTVELDARLDVTRTSFFMRRIMARSEWGEPAALSAAAYVALRSAVTRAEHAGDSSAFRPRAPMVATTAGQPNGQALARAPLAALAARGAAALVALAPSGRLAGVSVAAPSREAPATLAARLADPRSWHAFPGWRHVQPMPSSGTEPARVVVEDSLPFVDFDATWRLEQGPQARWWTAVEGAARGAWFGWEVFPPAGQAPTLAVFTMAPRLDATGSIPRRFIEAEPLLEHGMSLALAFVDAVGATRGGSK